MRIRKIYNEAIEYFKREHRKIACRGIISNALACSFDGDSISLPVPTRIEGQLFSSDIGMSSVVNKTEEKKQHVPFYRGLYPADRGSRKR